MNYPKPALTGSLAATVALLLCLSFACGKRDLPPPPSADMSLFPDIIGSFHRVGDPAHSFGNRFYANYEHGSNKVVVTRVAGENLIDPGLKDRVEVLSAEDNLAVTLGSNDELGFFVFDGKDGLDATAQTVDAMNDWLLAFPYSQFNVKTPAKPIELKFPPASFKYASPTGDPGTDESARKADLAIMGVWLKSSHHGSEAKVLKIDPSTMVVPAMSDEAVKQFMDDFGANLYQTGFRQVFAGQKRVELGASIDAKSGKRADALSPKKTGNSK